MAKIQESQNQPIHYDKQLIIPHSASPETEKNDVIITFVYIITMAFFIVIILCLPTPGSMNVTSYLICSIALI